MRFFSFPTPEYTQQSTLNSLTVGDALGLGREIRVLSSAVKSIALIIHPGRFRGRKGRNLRSPCCRLASCSFWVYTDTKRNSPGWKGRKKKPQKSASCGVPRSRRGLLCPRLLHTTFWRRGKKRGKKNLKPRPMLARVLAPYPIKSLCSSNCLSCKRGIPSSMF